MYVTHIKKPDEDEKESTSMNDAHHGAKLTYLPASSIRQLDVRRKAVPKRGIPSMISGWISRRRQAASPDAPRS